MFGKTTTPSFTLELKLSTAEQDEYALNKRFFLASKVKNILISHCIHRLNWLKDQRGYHDLLEERCKIKNAGLDEEEEKKALRPINGKLKEYVVAAGLDKSSLEKYIKVQQKKYSAYLDAHVCQSIVKEVLAGVHKVLYGDGKTLHHKRVNDLETLSGKANTQGMRFKDDRFLWLGLDIPVIIRPQDKYAQEVLYGDKVSGREPTHIKYVKLVRKMVGSRWHYYIQLVCEGYPPSKHQPGHGTVGIDNGPSVFAVVSDKDVSFEVLGIDTSDLDNKIEATQQAIDRSVRATNPDNYNEDGTIKRKRHRWKYSRHCKALKRRLTSLYRKKAARLKQSTEETANRILSQGDRFITEPLPLKSLQKRAQKTTINTKTGRPNKKKRFGKSIQNHSPGAVIAALDRKLHYFGLQVEKVNLSTYRASQYDHVTGEYHKKTLDQRWVKIGSVWVQRDLYSAFLLAHPNLSLDAINQAACQADFEQFKKQHDVYIQTLRDSNVKLPSCCGIHLKKTS